MKLFIIKILLFSLPMMPFIIFTEMYYKKSGGDLNRIGKVSIRSNYRNTFASEENLSLRYQNLSFFDITTETNCDVLTIGDSFSEQLNTGYQNYISHLSNISIIHFDYKRPGNLSEMQFLFSASNSFFFKQIKTKFVILQSVERHILQRSKALQIKEKSFSRKDYNKLLNKGKRPKRIPNTMIDYLRFPIYSFFYQFDDNAFFSKAYKTKTLRKLFSLKEPILLFYEQDFYFLSEVRKASVSNLNKQLNDLALRLKAKGIQLIYLPCPDKFDLYYDYIANNRYPKNNFFNYLREEKKDYHFIDSKEILLKAMKSGIQDIYYADDTHWSPKGAKIIAKELIDVINKHK